MAKRIAETWEFPSSAEVSEVRSGKVVFSVKNRNTRKGIRMTIAGPRGLPHETILLHPQVVHRCMLDLEDTNLSEGLHTTFGSNVIIRHYHTGFRRINTNK